MEYVDSLALPSSWKLAPRSWGNDLHKLAPYVGGYPASLAHYFIARYSDPDAVVLDPFSGGGTTVLEALLMDRQGIGNDAFTYAYTLSSAKANPMTENDFAEYLREKLREAEQQPGNLQLLDNEDLLVFYSEKTLDELLRLRGVVAADNSSEAIFLKAVICGVLHGPSKMFLSLSMKDTVSSTANYIRRYVAEHGLTRPERSVFECAMNKMHRSVKDGLPKRRGTVLLGDARAIDCPDASVNLIVTSPPYLHVLDYSWNNWIRLWWLAKDRKEARSALTLTGVESTYRRFMQEVTAEMYRLLKQNSAAVIVVGDVKRVRPKGQIEFINSALLIAEEAEKVGFEVECIVNDPYKFKNRAMLVYNSLKWEYDPNKHEAKSSVPVDRCLVLRKGGVTTRPIRTPWLPVSGMRQLGLPIVDIATD